MAGESVVGSFPESADVIKPATEKSSIDMVQRVAPRGISIASPQIVALSKLISGPYCARNAGSCDRRILGTLPIIRGCQREAVVAGGPETKTCTG